MLVGVVATYGTFRVVDLFNKEARQSLSRDLARHLADQHGLSGLARPDADALQVLFDMQKRVNPNIEIYLLDRDGRVMSHSGLRSALRRERVGLTPLLAFLSGKAEFPLYADDPLDTEARRIFSVAALPPSGVAEGYLYVVLTGDDQVTMKSIWRDSNVIRLGLAMVGLVLLLGLAAGLMLFASMTRRLERLARDMDEFKRTDFTARASIVVGEGARDGDEIDRLSANFRDLAARTAAQFAKLKQTDVLRRELVANVSHDLKTPLATLQGYVDTLLLKDDRLDRAERLNYLQIASRSCERLSKLVADLIELAKLDAREVTLQKEAFSPAELLQDVAQKFQLKAEQRRISLECDLPERMPYVEADIGLIERVLENLIGNALVHTDPGGVVRLGLQADPGKVTLRVADTGVGIPAEDLPHVFDRFYRVTHGQRGGGEHAGLGLAITKSILDLHGATMHVASELGVGTTFAFSLDRVAGTQS